MRILVTGLNGTLAPRVAVAAHWRGLEVIGWDRSAVDPDDGAAAARWLATARPDAIAHLATGNAAWAGQLADHASSHDLPMVFISTAMVFDHEPDGPHHPHHLRTARDDYGRSKIVCEDAVLAGHPRACIARIGWQIDATRPGNNMLLQLDQWQQREGRVAASRAWRPACSFIDDTAAALVDLLVRPAAGIVHLDSNADEGHGFDRIVQALKHSFGRDHWQIHVNEDYRHDQRLVGGGRHLPPLSARLAI